MEPISANEIAASAWEILRPYISMIAAKTAEKVSQELPASAGKLWNALKSKFVAKPSADEALTDLLRSPDDSDLQAAFRVQLKKVLEEDPAFAEVFKGLVEEAGSRVEVKVRDGAAAIGDHNKVVGKGGVIIEGSIGGDFHAPGSEKTEK